MINKRTIPGQFRVRNQGKPGNKINNYFTKRQQIIIKQKVNLRRDKNQTVVVGYGSKYMQIWVYNN